MFKETELFRSLLKEATGKTVEEIINEDIYTLTPERDASKRFVSRYIRNVRIYSGRFHTARDIIEKIRSLYKK